MTQLLIQGSSILAQAPLTDTGDAIHSVDCIYPKTSMSGWQIIDVAVPSGFVPSAYTWNGAALVQNSVTFVAPVPQSVTRFQGMAALQKAGLLSKAQSIVSASTDPMVSIAWNNTSTFDRGSPTVAAISAALSLTSAQVDALFVAASQITA
jgi:hypothetical protein